MRPQPRILAVGIAAILAQPVWGLEFLSDSGVSTRGPEVLNRAIGARALGMGGAGVPMADDASALFWNPAGIQEVERPDVFFSHEVGFAEETLDALALARPVWWRGRRQTVGIGLAYLTQKSFDVREGNETVGQAQPYDLVGSVAYAQPWGRGTIGLTGKYIRQQLYSTSAQAFALDIGANLAGPRWRLGGAVVNLGTQLKGSGESVGLPLAIKGGAAYRAHKGRRSQLWGVLQADAPADDQLVIHAGVEYRAHLGSTWEGALRGGFQGNGVGEGPSLGFGLGREGWGINYAFQTLNEVGDAHRLDISLRFGKALSQELRREELLAQAGREVEVGRLLQARDTVSELRALAPKDPAVRELHQDLERRFSESIDPQTLFLQGFHSYNTGDFVKAVDLFEKLLVVDPAHPEARDWLQRSRTEAESARASRLKSEVSRAKEKEWEAKRIEAMRAESESRWEDAARAWRRCRDLNPTSQEVRDGLARSRAALVEQSARDERAGNWGSALAAAQTALSAGDPTKELTERVARLDRGQAERRRQEAQDKYTEGAEAYRAQDWEKARRLFKEALGLSPEDRTFRRALERLNAEHPAP